MSHVEDDEGLSLCPNTKFFNNRKVVRSCITNAGVSCLLTFDFDYTPISAKHSYEHQLCSARVARPVTGIAVLDSDHTNDRRKNECGRRVPIVRSRKQMNSYINEVQLSQTAAAL